MVVAKTPEPRSYYLDTDSNATVRRNRRQLNPNPKEAKYAAGSPLPDPPETSKDQPPVPSEKKDVAFWIIPIQSYDYGLLGMHWQGSFHCDRCMPTGCASSCRTFEIFSTAVEWVARHKLKN